MKKDIIIFIFTVLILSCSNYKCFVDDNVTMIMDDFYLSNLRYPINATDYCYRFYQCDSVNDFLWIKEMADKDGNVQLSYKDYADCLDSLYYDMMRIEQFQADIYYQYGLRHSTIDLIKDKDKILLIDRCRKCKLSPRNYICDVFESFYGQNITFDDFIIYHHRNWRRTCQYKEFKAYSSDTLLLNLPDSILDKNKANKDIYKICNIPIQNTKNPNSKYYIMRYSPTKGLYNANSKYFVLNDLFDDKSLCNYLDSIIKKDERISFVQFVLFYENKDNPL